MRALLGILLTDVAAAVGDLVLTVMWVKGEVTSLGAIGMHAALSVALVCLATLMHRGLTANLISRGLTLLLLGPLGGFAIAMQRSAQVLRRDKRFDLTEMADRLLDPRGPALTAAETIYAQVRQGRRLQPAGAPPEAFLRTFAQGDILAQQAAIASISRHYHPSMLPALMAALRADIPAIRVQAAAVFAKLRENFDARAKMLLTRQPSRTDGNEALAAFGRDCREVARSGFLDQNTIERLEAAADTCDPAQAQHRRLAMRERAAGSGSFVHGRGKLRPRGRMQASA